MAEFDPNNAGVDETLKKLEKADEAERQRILDLEVAGKKRKTVLEPYGIDPDARFDATGRVLYPWEVSPDKAVVAVEVEESEQARQAREAQAVADARVAGDQGGETASDVGVADPGVADTP